VPSYWQLQREAEKAVGLFESRTLPVGELLPRGGSGLEPHPEGQKRNVPADIFFLKDEIKKTSVVLLFTIF
jgi:hypothetical protein